MYVQHIVSHLKIKTTPNTHQNLDNTEINGQHRQNIIENIHMFGMDRISNNVNVIMLVVIVLSFCIYCM